MKRTTLYMLLAVIFAYTCGTANADLRSDDFDDNSQAPTWLKLEQDPHNCRVDETNGHLEVTANGLAWERDALYVSKWYLIPTDDFQVKVDFYNNIISDTWNEVYIGVGYRQHLEDFKQDYVYLAAGCDESTPGLWYEEVKGGSIVAEGWKERFSNSGTLYISYNKSQDELYLSDAGYGSTNAWKTFSGVVQGTWVGRLFGVGVGGSSEQVVMGPGRAYLDNFVVDSGTLCTEIPVGDLSKNCRVDFEDFALFALSWLDCNLDPLEAGWGTAELIETDNAGDALIPQVAVDVGGNAVAVWNQYDGTRWNIWSNRYVAGTGWGTAELIETDNAGDAYYPQVVVDGGGNAVAVWHQHDGARYNILSNRYVAGTGWGTAELIETDAVSASEPQVAVDVGGNAVAVWRQYDGTYLSIWSNRYVAGTGWGTAELIETDNAGHAYDPQVEIDVGGNAVAVWYQHDGTRRNIWSNRYVAGSGWGTAELIETDTEDALYPQVAVDGSGNAVAVWEQSDGTHYNILSNRYVAGTGWGTAEVIETYNEGDADEPQVAVDVGGNAVAVWGQRHETYLSIWSNRYVAGTGWGTAEPIEDNAEDARYPQVAVDVGGNAVAVWYQDDGTRYNIWSNRYVAGSGWGTAELIETDNAGDAKLPQAAVDSGGNAVAVWYQHEGARYNIWSNRYVKEE